MNTTGRNRNIDIEAHIKRLEVRLNKKQQNMTAYHHAIVDTPFIDPLAATQLDLGIVALLLISQENKTIDCVALSNTEQAKKIAQLSAKPFHEIRISVGHPSNTIAKAIETHTFQYTEDWEHLFTPELTPQEAHFNQARAGIECSVVYPLNISSGGALIYSYYQPCKNLTEVHKEFMAAYTNRASWLLEPIKKD